ncbi:SusC/RagA family TonB-linked outer membrane protein [Mucilaginibacter kameinonensis]|uniref:SusC/RagA family TonB-linked outer membrane protein n=1 Tax=Mucilaginibacter kameinonensis TaxID=452286 RepID=UPI000EF801EC|nr:TonB-dependent receptor [Mucilaginibacter kameinonensis]
MKKTLLKKYVKISKSGFYLGGIVLLFVSDFSSAAPIKTASHQIVGVVTKGNKENALTIKGRVIDRVTGQTIPGVSIRIKGATGGTVTDINGNFSIEAANNAVLVFTYIGYDPLDVPVDGQTTLNVRLQPAAKNLNEVIVVGYGAQKKTSSTAAVSTINTTEIAQKPVVNLTNSLVGRASGLIVTQGSGEPGFDASNIQIRGQGSFNRSAALLIVDGVPRDFSRLDPNTIASFTVLKDAAAVAPYGVAGANGVILVTTKQGRSGKASLTYNGYVGFQNPTFIPQYTNSYQYALMRNEANANDAADAGTQYVPFATDDDLQKYKDHSDLDVHGDSDPLHDIILKNRLITAHNITLSGGSDDIRYFASVGYTHQDGMWGTTYLNKYNGSLNLTANATKSTTVNFSVNSYVEDGHYPGTGAGSILDQAERTAPYTPVYFTNGLWGGYIGQSLVGEIYHSGYDINENSALLSQLSIDQKLPIKGLSIKGVISYDNGPEPLFNTQTSFQRSYRTPIPFYSVADKTKKPYTFVQSIQGSQYPSYSETYNQTHSITAQGLLNYAGSFGKSDITGLLVVENRTVKYKTFSAKKINYNLDIDELDFGGPAPSDATNSGHSDGQKQIGYVYRLGYAYDKKYLFEATGRYDGSYLFAPDHRWGFFPAFSAGWRISEEKFMKGKIDWIDNLKLRGSWGQSGAYPASGGNILTYQYLSPYRIASSSGVLNNTTTQGVYEGLQGNPDITWEKATKIDAGLEATLWNGALGFEVDYFSEKRSNLLAQIAASLPPEYGIGLGLVNGANMQNHGIDVTITSSKSFTKDLRLDIKATFTFARNKLVKVYEDAGTYANPNTRRTGRPNGTQFGLQALGYFTPADFEADGKTLKPGIPVPQFGAVRPGDLKYADLNGDGKINGNDQTVIGHPNTPEIIYGLEPRLSYKNFDIDLLIQGSGNSNIQLNNYFVWPFQASGSATELTYKDHWTPSNTDALYPRLYGTPKSNNTQSSSWWIRNNSYLRLRSFELGYTFSSRLLGKAMRSLRVYAAGQNVFTWTPSIKETIDPENSGSNENYFQQRVLSIGVNATF